MVAETLTADRAADGFPVFAPIGAGILCAAWGTYDLAANVEDGDIFEMCKVPSGATVIGGYLMGEDIDTDGTEALDLDIGWAANGDEVADPDGFGNLGVLTGDVSVHLPVAGYYIPLQGVLAADGPKTFNAETTIQIEANAAATAGGTGRLTLVVHYLVG